MKEMMGGFHMISKGLRPKLLADKILDVHKSVHEGILPLMSLAAATGLMETLFTKMERTAGRTGWRE